MKELEITIAPGQKPIIDVVSGPGGTGCVDMIRKIGDGLGDVDETELKDPYFDSETEVETESEWS